MDWDFVGTIIAPIVQAFASLIGVVGLVLVWLQIRETKNQLSATREQIKLNADQFALSVEQMRQQTKWQQINTQHTLLSVLPTQETERALWAVVERYRNPPSWQFPREACSKLYDNIEEWITIKTFVSAFERLCAAINANSLDDDYAYSVHGAKVIDTFSAFEHYIYYIRKRRNDETIYIELEKVATRWAERSKAEQASIREEQAQMQARRGAKRAFG
ncbi:MAG: DUF4760 domain-containing protein [Proteobacteria bacterium]|nr:DUF4760 domain-containing protein [Pseudomonadota bacterium]MBS0492694.1 DUF4760 domain-containing protein [Pseudomonadota bacterium]